MTQKAVLYLLMETKARELEGRTLLGLEAALHGFPVVLGRKGHITRAIARGALPPGVVFEKSITRGKEGKLGGLSDRGCVIVSQDEESGLLDFSYDQFLSFRSSHDTLDQVEAVFCWGEHDREAWVECYPASRDKIHATGSPRVDFWRKDFAPYFDEGKKVINDRFGDFVLVSSNFVLANSSMTPDERIRQGKENGSIASADDEALFLRKVEDSHRMFALFVEMLSELSRTWPDRHFVVRPHPAENVDGWKRALPQRPNLHVVFDGGVDQWVRASSAVLHNGCTTGIEAYAAGKPAIAYVPFKSPINREVPNAVSMECQTVNEVRDVLEGVFSGRADADSGRAEKDALMKRRLINLYQRNTAAGEICRVLSRIPSPGESNIADIRGKWVLDLKDRIQKTIYMLKGNSPKGHEKFPSLKRTEVEGVRDRLARVFPDYRRCQVRHLYGDVFAIEAKSD